MMKRLAIAVLGAAARRLRPDGRPCSRRPASRCRSKPLLASRPPTAEQLLTAADHADPERVDELVKRGEPRKPDRFDLPPPDGGAAPVLPETEEPASSEQNRRVDPAMNEPVRKAVFPVAGLGTRLLPATKTMPKEMLTIVDRPLIQYAVDEAREAGIEQMIFVTGRGKSSLVDYFDIGFELETTMRRGRQEPRRAGAVARADYGEIVAVRQQQPLGLGHAVWCARHIVGDEPFAVLLPDDLMAGTPGALKQMVDACAELGGNMLCTEEVPAEQDRQLRHHHARADRRRR